MERKAVSGIMLTLLLISMLTLTFNIQRVQAEPKTWIVDDDGPADFSSIQEAINSPDVEDEDTLFVFSGIYYEHVVVNKTVSLVGESKETTIIDGSMSGTVVKVIANNVLISNFTIRNSGSWSPAGDSGIRLSASHCKITNNIIKNNKCVGIGLYYCSNNILFGNNLTANGWDGIQLYRSSNNTVSGNDITANYDYGIWLHSSSNCNVISGNNITKNRCYGVYHWRCSYNKISGNNIIANGWSGFYLDWSPNNSICSNNITANGWDGIYLYESSNNIMSGNSIINNNQSGFEVHFSSKTIISENNITANSRCGIFIALSYGNYIYHNNFVENTISQATKFWYVDAWDDGYPSGGNYWSDHVTVDEYSGINQDELGSDGIVDEPYIIDAYNQDNYPLTEPWTPLPRTIYELKTEIEELGSEGEIDNQGIVRSLIAKLNVAQKLVDKGKIIEANSILEDDLIPQVQNLSGIHITVEAADLLIKSAESIVSHL